MEKSIRKILSMVLALTMVLAMLPAGVFAAESDTTGSDSAVAPEQPSSGVYDSGTCGENLTWILEFDGTLTISGTGAMTNYNENWNDSYLPAPWSSLPISITDIVIGDGVTHIGDYAFSWLNSSSSIDLVLPDSVVSIGANAFYAASSIHSIDFGSSLETIGSNAFFDCDYIYNLAFPATLKQIDEDAFSDCNGITRIAFNGDAPTINASAFTSLVASSFYPADNATWTAEIVGGDYGAQLTWVEGAPTTVPVIIASGVCGEGSTNSITWTLNDSARLTVTGSGAMVTADEFSCPWDPFQQSIRTASIGEGITSIGAYAFYGCYNLKSITLPTTIKVIDGWAFGLCQALQTLALPEGLTTIGEHAFDYCTILTGLTLPSTLTTIGDYAFSECLKMNELQLPERLTNIGAAAFYLCPGLVDLKVPAGTAIGPEAFYGSIALKSVEIPAGVTEIGELAFSGCSALTTINLPSSINTIGDYAFFNCTALEQVGMSVNVTTLGAGAFANCDVLASITLPNGVTEIQPETFANCFKLANVTLGKNVTAIGENAFTSCGLTSIKLPNTMTTIGDSAFYSCFDLKQVDLGTGVTSIGTYAFSTCSSLNTITLPATLTTMGDLVFEGCDTLCSVVFLGSAPTVEASIFQDDQLIAYYPAGNATWTDDVKQPYGGTVIWTAGTPATNPVNLASGTLGDGMTWTLDCFGQLVISGQGEIPSMRPEDDPAPWADVASKVSSIKVSSGITAIGPYAFYTLNNATSIHLGEDVGEIGFSALGTNIETVTLDPANTAFDVVDGVLYAYQMGKLIFCPRKYSGTFTVPEGVTSIGENAFENCENLVGITLPSTLEIIYSNAFAYSGLTDVTIPEGVYLIYSNAFEGCPLTEINLPNSLQTIGDRAFMDTDITEVTLPRGIIFMGEEVFRNCENLTKVTINTAYPDLDMPSCFKGCYNLSTIETNADNFNYRVSGGILYSKDMTRLLYCPPTASGVVTIPEGVVELAQNAFQDCDAITGVNFPATTLKVIGDYAFEGCDSLQNITMPNSAVYLGENAFSMCSNLLKVTLCKNLTSIPSNAFSHCALLSTVEIPDSVTSIGASAFYSSGLTSLVIPASVTKLGEGAFSYCTGLNTIVFSGNAPIFGNRVFDSAEPIIYYPTNNATWTPMVMLNYAGYPTWIPIGSTSGVSTVDFGWCGDNLQYHLNSDGVLVIYGTGEMTTTPWTDYNPDIHSVMIGSNVTSIMEDALSGCTTLTEITIPQSVASIGSEAFARTGLTSITFLGEAPNISTNAFTGVTATAAYPTDSTTWNADTMLNYGGTLTWKTGDAMKEFAILPKYPTLALEDEVKYSIYFTLQDADLVSIEEMGLITFHSEPTDGNIDDADAVIPGSGFNGSYYFVQSEGIPAKELGDEMYFRVYVRLADGSYVYSKTYHYSAVTYVKSTLSSSNDEGLKQLCVAMMNYGTAAQAYFGYKTDAPMNSFLTDAQKAMLEPYTASMADPIVKADSSKAGQFVYNAAGFTKRYPSVSLGGAFSITYYITPALDVDTTMILYYWTMDDYSAADVLTPENASGSVMMDGSYSEYSAAVSGIAAKNLDETVYVSAIYTSGGETYSTGVLAYTVSAACSSKVGGSNTVQSALSESIIVYGYYAKNHFKTN